MSIFARILLLSLCMLPPVQSAAQTPLASFSDPASGYYLNPQPDTVSDYIKLIDDNDAAARSKSQGFVIGFMSEIFRTNPDRVDRWLGEFSLSKNTQRALVYALWLADMHAPSLSAMKRFGWPTAEVESIALQMTKVKNLDAITPNSGNDLDMFWGAFFASGDKSRVDRILLSYNDRARKLQIDPRDILLTTEVIHTRNPDPAAVDRIKQFKSKYGERRAFEIVIAATALWALGSNSQQHDRVRAVVTDHLKGAPEDAATKALAKHLAQASKKFIGLTANTRVFFVTTRDPGFSQGPMKNLFDKKELPNVDKVFGKSDQSFAALSAVLNSKEQLEYEIELIGVKGGTRRSAGKLAGLPASASIQAAMIPLVPEPAGARGLHEIVLTVRGTETPKQRFQTMVYFDDE